MKTYHFQGLLNHTKWIDNVYVSIDTQGIITAISDQRPDGHVEDVNGYAIPGFQNAHSHAFQYAMAGLAEHMSSAQDDFWSWREAMYSLALSVTPDDVEAIATQLYSEMLRQGYTHVAEFHYLHHAPSGSLYDDPAEMSLRIMRAAAKSGIGLTLIPIFYNRGDFGKEASSGQRRFLSQDTSAYARLKDAASKHAKEYDVLMATGIHSLRAASSDHISELFQAHPKEQPLHLHIAEQSKEVKACEAFYGKRPVQWLLDNQDVGAHCHLVHATHLDHNERKRLAESKATSVICTTTEGNLGDGFFPIKEYLNEGGRIAIGSDSHVGLSPLEELRWLDYGMRLRQQGRNVICNAVGQDSGARLFHAAHLGGAQANGVLDACNLDLGHPLNALVIDADAPLFSACPPQRRLSTLIYGCDVSMNLGTMRKGEWVVRNGKHNKAQEIRDSFRKTLKRLRK